MSTIVILSCSPQSFKWRSRDEMCALSSHVLPSTHLHTIDCRLGMRKPATQTNGGVQRIRASADPTNRVCPQPPGRRMNDWHGCRIRMRGGEGRGLTVHPAKRKMAFPGKARLGREEGKDWPFAQQVVVVRYGGPSEMRIGSIRRVGQECIRPSTIYQHNLIPRRACFITTRPLQTSRAQQRRR